MQQPAGACVLVAEDEERVRGLVVRVLEGAGYRVREAASGPEALQALAGEEAIDVLVLDLAMPGATPDAVLAAAHARRPAPGVVLTSGASLPSGIARGLRAVGGLFLPKPFAPAALLEAVAGQRDRGAQGR